MDMLANTHETKYVPEFYLIDVNSGKELTNHGITCIFCKLWSSTCVRDIISLPTA